MESSPRRHMFYVTACKLNKRVSNTEILHSEWNAAGGLLYQDNQQP